MNGLLKLLVIEDRTNLAVAIACPEWRHYFHLGLTNILSEEGDVSIPNKPSRNLDISYLPLFLSPGGTPGKSACLLTLSESVELPVFPLSLSSLSIISSNVPSSTSRRNLVDEESLKVLTTRMVVTVLGS